jgi:hypothetical protein
MGSRLQIVRKEQSSPENYAHFYLRGERLRKEIRVVLCNGHAIECSRHRDALTEEPCECMRLVNASPDKDQYWQPIKQEDFSDLFE